MFFGSFNIICIKLGGGPNSCGIRGGFFGGSVGRAPCVLVNLEGALEILEGMGRTGQGSAGRGVGEGAKGGGPDKGAFRAEARERVQTLKLFFIFVCCFRV